MKEYFLAYDENVGTAAMKKISIYSKLEMKCLLNGWALRFSQVDRKVGITIVKSEQSKMPAVVWKVFEGKKIDVLYPDNLWQKKYFRLKSSEGEIEVFTYILREYKSAVPQEDWIEKIAESYSEHNFDFEYIENALDYAADMGDE